MIFEIALFGSLLSKLRVCGICKIKVEDIVKHRDVPRQCRRDRIVRQRVLRVAGRQIECSRELPVLIRAVGRFAVIRGLKPRPQLCETSEIVQQRRGLCAQYSAELRDLPVINSCTGADIVTGQMITPFLIKSFYHFFMYRTMFIVF